MAYPYPDDYYQGRRGAYAYNNRTFVSPEWDRLHRPYPHTYPIPIINIVQEQAANADIRNDAPPRVPTWSEYQGIHPPLYARPRSWAPSDATIRDYEDWKRREDEARQRAIDEAKRAEEIAEKKRKEDREAAVEAWKKEEQDKKSKEEKNRQEWIDRLAKEKREAEEKEKKEKEAYKEKLSKDLAKFGFTQKQIEAMTEEEKLLKLVPGESHRLALTAPGSRRKIVTRIWRGDIVDQTLEYHRFRWRTDPVSISKPSTVGHANKILQDDREYILIYEYLTEDEIMALREHSRSLRRRDVLRIEDRGRDRPELVFVRRKARKSSGRGPMGLGFF